MSRDSWGDLGWLRVNWVLTHGVFGGWLEETEYSSWDFWRCIVKLYLNALSLLPLPITGCYGRVWHEDREHGGCGVSRRVSRKGKNVRMAARCHITQPPPRQAKPGSPTTPSNKMLTLDTLRTYTTRKVPDTWTRCNKCKQVKKIPGQTGQTQCCEIFLNWAWTNPLIRC